MEDASYYTEGDHNLTVLSLDADARMVPFDDIATALTGPSCSVNLKALIVGLKFQSMRELSREDEIICFMFGLKTTPVTPSLCPRKLRCNVGSDILFAKK